MIYVVADLHGRFDLLEKAINIIEADAGSEPSVFICLGDFIDRGPQSRQIIERFIAGPSLDNWTWIILQGNHEDIMLQALEQPHKLDWWVGNGGGRTLQSYGYKDGDTLYPLKVPKEHTQWLKHLPVYYQDDHRVYVHAGIPDDGNLHEQSKERMQWMLYQDNDSGGWRDKEVVHGHHQFKDGPRFFTHRTNLDTYAWRYGRLAIGVFDPEIDGGPVRLLWAEGSAL